MAGARGTGTKPAEQEWAEVVFDSSVTPDQRTATLSIVSHLYPVQWLSFTVVGESADLLWETTPTHARASLAGGKAEIALVGHETSRRAAATDSDPARYAAAPRDDGIVAMRSEAQTYNLGTSSFRATDTSGLVVTVDMSSSDLAK
jgi:hypothetical protein